ncbi:hypothetical protein GJ153_18180 [Salmonella enterica subsp. enterica]|nr:hypothetical protein [Salmonella enterica subsp. enterica serovar Kottbus]EEL6460079.1 hypothetical protein [Salmonella enterica subsp. enterica serovar Kottbus]
MKKTLIALAVAASATVSGSAVSDSAMEWSPNGLGKPFRMGGTLTPKDVVTPWEVKTGPGADGANLNAVIKKGRNFVDINVERAIPVLGIRNANQNGFVGIAVTGNPVPKISYGDNAVNVDSFEGGTTTLTLDVNNTSGSKIGTLTAPFSAAGYSTWIDNDNASGSVQLMSSSGGAYYGGLGKTSSAVRPDVQSAYDLLKSLDSEYVAKTPLGTTLGSNIVDNEMFNNPNDRFKSAYGAGIEAGKTIRITLSSPASGDDPVAWKATLPVTVSYQ